MKAEHLPKTWIRESWRGRVRGWLDAVGVDQLDAGADQLQAQLGGRVDEDVAAWGGDEGGAAVAVVARVLRAAHGAVTWVRRRRCRARP